MAWALSQLLPRFASSSINHHLLQSKSCMIRSSSSSSFLAAPISFFFPRHVNAPITPSFSVHPHSTKPSADEGAVLGSAHHSSNKDMLEPGLYIVATPIGNLEDITLRALRVLRSVDLILAEDTRHSGKLLQHYNIQTPLLSYHKFNESQRGSSIIQKLQHGDIIALISDAGTPGINDPGTQLVKLCVDSKVPVFPVPGPSAVITALSASGLSTDEFTYVGFLSKHAATRRQRLALSSKDSTTQIFYVPPHKLHQFLEEAIDAFGRSRKCVIAREMTKLYEEFWHGSLGQAQEVFSENQPKGEITLLVEGNTDPVEAPSEDQIEHELRTLVSEGHSISMAVKRVAESMTVKKKTVYAMALNLFGDSTPSKEEYPRVS